MIGYEIFVKIIDDSQYLKNIFSDIELDIINLTMEEKIDRFIEITRLFYESSFKVKNYNALNKLYGGSYDLTDSELLDLIDDLRFLNLTKEIEILIIMKHKDTQSDSNKFASLLNIYSLNTYGKLNLDIDFLNVYGTMIAYDRIDAVKYFHPLSKMGVNIHIALMHDSINSYIFLSDKNVKLNPYKFDKAMDILTEQEGTQILKYFLDSGYEFTSKHFEDVLKYGHLPVFEFFMNLGFSINKYPIESVFKMIGNNYEILKYLFEKDHKILWIKNEFLASENEKVVKLALEYGADPNYNEGILLKRAVRFCNLDLVKLSIRCGTNKPNEDLLCDILTTEYYVPEKQLKAYQIFEELIKYGVNYLRDIESEKSYFYLAVKHEYIRYLRIVLKYSDIRDYLINVGFIIACKKTDKDRVVEFLEMGADVHYNNNKAFGEKSLNSVRKYLRENY